MEGNWMLVLCAIVLAALRTAAMSTGAPEEACDTFTPNHGSNTPQMGDGGFKLYSNLIDNGGSYQANQEYNITLRHEDNTTTFRGFLIGARTSVGGGNIGTFSTDSNSQYRDCANFGTDESTVTHTDNNDKQLMMFTWTAPFLSGTVKFRYAVVKSYATFYANLELPEETPIVSPSTSIGVLPSFTSSLPILQPTPTVMVPDCPATDKNEDSDFPLTFGLPPNCEREDCDLYAAMGPNTANGDFLDIYLEGTADGWVAVGFSEDKMMNNTDVVGCRVSSGEVLVRDAWNPGQFNQDDQFADYGVCVHSNNHINGRITCLFSKYGLKVEENEDFDLKDGSYWIIIGMKDSEPTLGGNDRFVKHSTTPTFSIEQYNPFTDNNEGVVIITEPPQTVCPAAPDVNQAYNLVFGSPLGCAKDDCDYYVAMRPNAENTEFLDVYLQGKVAGWVAIGFSHDNMMGDTDVLGCKVANGDATVVDSWNTQSFNMLDSDQEGVCVHSTSLSNGVISCSFSRLGTAGSDSDDFNLNDKFWLMFGRRTTAPTLPFPGLQMHSSTPEISEEMYNPFAMDVTVSPTPPTRNTTCPSAPAPDATYPVEITATDGFYFAARLNDENPNYLDMIIQANSEGWIAIGFSATRQMAETDVFGCQVVVDGSEVNVKDSWNPLPNRSPNQLDQTQEGICQHDATYYDGAIRCKFSRHIEPLNEGTDLNLNQSLYRVYTRGSTRGAASESLSRHDTTPAFTDDSANIVSAAAGDEEIEDSVYPELQLIKTHGIFMLFSWPLLASSGIFFASWLKPALPNGEWFQVHRAVMIISLFTALFGFMMAFISKAKRSVPGLIEFDSTGTNTTHFVIGIIVVLLHIINPIIALFRCKPDAKRRWIFNLFHAGFIGFAAQILALINVCLGLWLINQSHHGFYVFIFFVAFFLVVEVTMFILTSIIAMGANVSKEELPKLVHSSVRYCLPKSSEPANSKESVEMEEKKDKLSADGDGNEKCQRKRPSKDARIRWASFGIFLVVSIIVFIVVTILVILD